jgi:hypothetical protein
MLMLATKTATYCVQKNASFWYTDLDIVKAITFRLYRHNCFFYLMVAFNVEPPCVPASDTTHTPRQFMDKLAHQAG